MGLFRRFYLKRTLFDADANRLMGTSVLLGAKLAEVYLKEETLEELLGKLKLPGEGSFRSISLH
jgi:hypothetical protein